MNTEVIPSDGITAKQVANEGWYWCRGHWRLLNSTDEWQPVYVRLFAEGLRAYNGESNLPLSDAGADVQFVKLTPP